MIYFDNAATTYPKPSCVSLAAHRAILNFGANPGRAGHRMSVETAQRVFETRCAAASFFGLPRSENVIFTKNCTEALNLVLHGLAKSGGHFVCSSLEHNAVARPLETLRLRGVADWSAAAVGETDAQTVENFRKCLREDTIAIVCTGASNVFGRVLPIADLAALAHAYGKYMIVDAAQTAGLLPIDMQKQGIDFLCVPAHKGLYGIMGVGMLLRNCGAELEPLQQGGTGVLSAQLTQPKEYPERLECGTLNVPGILALGAGLSFLQKKGVAAIFQAETHWITHIREALWEMPAVQQYTPVHPANAAYVPLLSFNIRGLDSEETAARLSEQGIAVRAGLHCAPLAHKAYGTFDSGTVRICPSVFTNEKDVKRLLNSVFQIAKSI